MHVSQVRVRAGPGVGAHSESIKGLCALLNSHQSEPQNRARLWVCVCGCAHERLCLRGVWEGVPCSCERVECD